MANLACAIHGDIKRVFLRRWGLPAILFILFYFIILCEYLSQQNFADCLNNSSNPFYKTNAVFSFFLFYSKNFELSLTLKDQKTW